MFDRWYSYRDRTFRLGESAMSMDAAVVAEWADQFGSLCDRLAECFGRRDLRRRARGYRRGLLGRMGRKNMRQLAEYLGDETPHGLQRLLDRAVLTASPADLPRLLDWSIWRRRHQAIARHCHYQAHAP